MLRFEKLQCDAADWLVNEAADIKRTVTYRAKIPGGWLVGMPEAAYGMTFVPDPEHKWDGNSLP